jgi:enamine deaminase RidA (YjgF/YER057c/UK114 family)
MPKQQISSDRIRQPSGHFSQATVVEARGRLVFISGMTARRADGSIAGIGDIESQTRQVCENLKAAVEAAGGNVATQDITCENGMPAFLAHPTHLLNCLGPGCCRCLTKAT